MTLLETLSIIEAKAKEIQSWESTTDLKIASDRFDKLHEFYDTGITLALVASLRVAREALELIGRPLLTLAESNSLNRAELAAKALTHIDELFEKEK